MSQCSKHTRLSSLPVGRWVILRPRRSVLVVLSLATLMGCSQGDSRTDDGGADNARKAPIRYAPVVISETNKEGVVTAFRPLVTRVRPEDSKRLALHWATTFGPGTWDWDFWRNEVCWRSTVASMEVVVTTPDGETHRLRLDPTDDRHLDRRELLSRPTLFLTLPEKGLAEEEKLFRWLGGEGLSLKTEGKYRVSATGTLCIEGEVPDLPFATGEVEFEVTKDCPPFEATLAAADRAMQGKGRRVSDISGAVRTDIYSAVIEDDKGNRIVRYQTDGDVGEWSWQEARVLVRPDGTIKDIRYRTIHECLAKGTLVETEFGPVAVENLTVGTRVWGYDLQKRARVLTTVCTIRRASAQSTVRFPSGLRVSGDHPIYASGRWKRAIDVKPTDLLLTSVGETLTAGKSQRLDFPVEVFDVAVGFPHNFFARGILVHNKSRLYSPFLDDPWYVLWPEPERPKDPEQRRIADAIEAAGGEIILGRDEPLGVAIRIHFSARSRPRPEDFLPLRRMKNLKALGFHQIESITAAAVQNLKGVNDLELLHFSCCPFGDEALVHLLTLPRLKDLSFSSMPITDEGLPHIGKLTQLRRLSLSGTKVTDAGMGSLCKLKDLEVLSLMGAAVTDDGLVHVGKLTKLKDLELADTKVTGKGFVHLAKLKGLERIRTAFAGDGLVYLQALPRLKDLDLGYEQVDNDSLADLAPIKSLESLRLKKTSITDEGLRHLQGLTRLQILDLKYTRVGDAGLKYLETLGDLRVLLLSHTRITDAGLRHLKALKKLERLRMEHTAVTDGGVKDLQDALPNCTIGE